MRPFPNYPDRNLQQPSHLAVIMGGVQEGRGSVTSVIPLPLVAAIKGNVPETKDGLERSGGPEWKTKSLSYVWKARELGIGKTQLAKLAIRSVSNGKNAGQKTEYECQKNRIQDLH